MEYDAYDALLHHIYKSTQGDAWFKPSASAAGGSTGAVLRVGAHQFRVFPDTPATEGLATAVAALNPEVAVAVRSAAVNAALAKASLDATSLPIDDENRIQILRTIHDVARAEKGQGAAFIRDERLLVVWSDRVDDIIGEVKAFDKLLLQLVWQKRLTVMSTPEESPVGSSASSAVGVPTSGASSLRQLVTSDAASRRRSPLSRPGSNIVPHEGGDEKGSAKTGSGSADPVDEKSPAEDGPEAEEGAVEGARPVRLYAPVYNGLATGLSVFFVGTGLNKLLTAFVLDGSYTRFVLIITLPLLFCISLFFCLTLITNVAFVFGPIAQYHSNSKYYSAVAPPAPPKSKGPERLPHITIQMPVYKEGLEAVITPSIDSLQRAMLTYARQGGSSSIFINEDGMQVIKPEDQAARRAFYENRGIGWVARPPHAKDGFTRAGRFKKASNMNFCLAVGLRMEQILLELAAAANAADAEAAARGLPAPRPAHEYITTPELAAAVAESPLTPAELADDGILAERALALACAETGGLAWAAGARSIKMGEIILLVDSDTQVPEDCLRDAAREMAASPEVAIIQHESDAMQVAHHYFENGIAYFTRRINHAISVACSNGEVAPFVGHNAFLRWTAVQEAAFVDPADGKRKFWSEAHVSEDFDMALRLQLAGYTIRWATYVRGEGRFSEGVSLTVDDELNRWQKYAYGCSELLFQPFRYWLTRGPVTKQFHKFAWSPVPIHYKISMMAYMFSYYALASALPLSILNYCVLGWQLRVDDFYSHSWELWLACTVVFLGAGNIGFSVLTYRLNQRNLFAAFWENIKWLPFFFFFFGGLSLHLGGAMLAHLTGYNITWSSTIKEVEQSNFFKEVPRIWKRFWGTFLICGLLSVGMIILSTSLVPRGFRVDLAGWSVIFTLALQTGCHLLFPIVLNPWLMIFSY